jgi:hypothetical protein
MDRGYVQPAANLGTLFGAYNGTLRRSTNMGKSADWDEGYDAGKLTALAERDALERDLRDFIDHVEEQNVLMAEVFLTHGYDPVLLDELCEKYSGFHLRDAVQLYERVAKEAREKWKFPRV